MATKSKRKVGSDRQRVSSQAHELGYTGGKVAKRAGTSRRKGVSAVKAAKRQIGSVSRGKVERRATANAR